MAGKRCSLAAVALLAVTGCGRTAMELQAQRRDASPEAAGTSVHDAGPEADAADAADAADTAPPPGCADASTRFRVFGHGSDSMIHAVAVDDTGNVAVTGAATGTVDFGGGPLQPTNASGSADMFVAKLDAGGKHLWSARFGNAWGWGVALAKSGGVIVTGTFIGALDLGNGALVANGAAGNVFLAEFDASGTVVWRRGFGDPQGQGATGLAIDDAGDIFLVGRGYGSIDFGCGPLQLRPTPDAGPYGDESLFAARFDSAGKCLWSRAFSREPIDPDGSSSEPALAVTPAGRAVIGIADLGDATDFGAGYQSGPCVAELDVDGALRWTRCLSTGAANLSEAFDVAASDVGEVALTGYSTGAVLNDYVAYAGVLDPSGQQPEWLHQTNFDQYTEFATGVFAPGSRLVTGGAPENTGSRAAVHAFRPDGTGIWSAKLPQDFRPLASAADPAGNVWFAGFHAPWHGLPVDAALVELEACAH